MTPLSALPTTSSGREVSYTTRDGLLGIRSSQSVLGLFSIGVTIWTKPTLTTGRLELVPQTVEILGKNRPLDDSIAARVMGEVDRSALGRDLPSLPKGVGYTAVSVDGEGIKVDVDGTVVTPFSALPNPSPGAKGTYGTRDGKLTVTTVGSPKNAKPLSLDLITTPRLEGSSLVLEPNTVTLFNQQFDAQKVFAATGGGAPTTFPLQPLSTGLGYTRLEVLPEGLRFTVEGKGLRLSKDLLGGSGC